MKRSDVVGRVLYREPQIKKRAKQLAIELAKDYKDKYPIVVCTLKGSFMFFADLMKKFDCNCDVGFIKASSYVNTTSTGNVKIANNTLHEIKGRHILIIEDIVDTGYTIDALTKYFKKQGALSVETCAMLNKPSRRILKEINPKYVAFDIDDLFVIGYGLDYNEKYRNLPYIGVINPKYIED
ncbi:MAG: hypoxanthine phosphoribosyltransferase [Bacilli bacterium]